MRRSALAAALLVLVASAVLPGCIAVIGKTKPDAKDTPNARALTDLERRMDRVEQHLPK